MLPWSAVWGIVIRVHRRFLTTFGSVGRAFQSFREIIFRAIVDVAFAGRAGVGRGVIGFGFTS